MSNNCLRNLKVYAARAGEIGADHYSSARPLPSFRLLPVVPVNLLPTGNLSQINQQELKRVHHLAKLPISTIVCTSEPLELQGNRFCG